MVVFVLIPANYDHFRPSEPYHRGHWQGLDVLCHDLKEQRRRFEQDEHRGNLQVAIN